MKKIVIDAGHGGSDGGATANGIVEKDYTLKISNYMYDRLKELGVPVSITRSTDITLDPNERVEKAFLASIEQTFENIIHINKLEDLDEDERENISLIAVFSPNMSIEEVQNVCDKINNGPIFPFRNTEEFFMSSLIK